MLFSENDGESPITGTGTEPDPIILCLSLSTHSIFFQKVFGSCFATDETCLNTAPSCNIFTAVKLAFWKMFFDLEFLVEKYNIVVVVDQCPFISSYCSVSHNGMICQKHNTNQLNHISGCFRVYSKFVDEQFSSLRQAVMPSMYLEIMLL